MRVLLLGGGGREHAIGWKLVQSPKLDALISCPGNPGLAELGLVVPDIDPTDAAAIIKLVAANSIDLVIVGPEAPLAAGIADALTDLGIAVFGPSKAGAQLEASKSFAKDVMVGAGIPTASSETFTDATLAKAHLAQTDGPYVVKANGLAAGKGVLVTESLQDADAWVDECLEGRFGSPDASVVIEEYMDGDEVSVFFLCSDGVAVSFEPARDYKRLSDGDHGPNTGGMGSYSPVDDLPADLVEWTTERVALPALSELERRGISYTGFLYVGLMLTSDGPRVIEFNVRLGDPETQALMPRLSSDLLAAIDAATRGALSYVDLRWTETATVNVVLAADGYPVAPRTGDEIDLGTPTEGSIVFHAGTSRDGDRLLTGGGRVLNVVGTGDTIDEARMNAYATAATIKFTGKHFRTDIGAIRRDS
ncbi:MAG: phosphoribosylamine--glycine ligase [Armatimonadetes bacterium]|nr:MAG: phosphoribosylamine--glycine ligase [Armatimonadota bacterium]